MTWAPAGTSTLAPTAAILPSRMTTVPSSMGEPARVKILACVIATTEGDCANALRLKEASDAPKTAQMEISLARLTGHLRKQRLVAGAWACRLASFLLVFSRLVWRRAFCQAQSWRPAFFRRLFFLSPSTLSFLFRGSRGRRCRACGRSKCGHQSEFAEQQRRR